MTIEEKLVAIAANEEKVYQAGYTKGQNEADTEAAYNEGYETGYTEGSKYAENAYNRGKQDEYDSFWNAYQANGSRREYDYTFFDWADDYYKPKYIPKASKAVNMYGMSSIKEITVDLTIATTSLSNTFGNCSALKKLTVYSSQNTSWASTTFVNTSLITDLTIIGTIGKSITISALVRLTHDSLMSVINALKDYSESGTTYKLTMGTTNLAKLTDAEKAIATEKGWTLA